MPLTKQEIDKRFGTPVELDQEQADIVDAFRGKARVLATWIDKNAPDGRNKALCLTHLEDVVLRGVLAVAKDQQDSSVTIAETLNPIPTGSKVPRAPRRPAAPKPADELMDVVEATQESVAVDHSRPDTKTVRAWAQSEEGVKVLGEAGIKAVGSRGLIPPAVYEAYSRAGESVSDRAEGATVTSIDEPAKSRRRARTVTAS